MGCPAEARLEETLVFSITTHDPDTGILTDTGIGTPPTYRIYEDETGAAILDGTMAKLDDDNTTGFYSELIATTAAIGFEIGKTYSIYIEATVDGDIGGMTFGFKIIPAQGVQKNVALSNFRFTMVSSTDHITPVPGLTVTAEICRDAEGAFSAATNSVSEISSGVYEIDWTQTEMNADSISFKLTATGADQITIHIVTSK